MAVTPTSTDPVGIFLPTVLVVLVVSSCPFLLPSLTLKSPGFPDTTPAGGPLAPPIAASHPSVCCLSLLIPWMLDVGEPRGGILDFVLDLFSLSLLHRAARLPLPIDVPTTSESFFWGPALYTQHLGCLWTPAAPASVELISPSSKPFFSQLLISINPSTPPLPYTHLSSNR